MCETWLTKHPEIANETAGKTAGEQSPPQIQDPPAAGQNHDADWPKLAPAAFHGLAGEVVNCMRPSTESDPAALLLQYLVSFGNAIGRQPHYLVEETKHFANLYAVLAGPTSKGRKGTAADRISAISTLPIRYGRASASQAVCHPAKA